MTSQKLWRDLREQETSAHFNATYLQHFFCLDRLQRLRQYNDHIPATTFAPKCCWFPGTAKPIMAVTILHVAIRIKFHLEVTSATASYHKDQAWYKIIDLSVFNNKILSVQSCFTVFLFEHPWQRQLLLLGWRHDFCTISIIMSWFWRHNITTYLDSND